ncbi:follistatin-A-like [Ctenocephalides felis]|uniref:follistatin-A-like n=1 Tax=Ctenocephalides felis TaxID=7515 RepID=UPI000E6E3A43|nr:follistatin-A-like [Ctenocephalides felis]
MPFCGGLCWASMNVNGRCTELKAPAMSKKDCCSDNVSGTAWSEEDLDSGTLFFWRVLGGGVQCSGCKESCSEVKCDVGEKCVERNGRPKCVCAPDCRGSAKRTLPKHVAGKPVCGTDGKSYRTLCRLKKRACRRKNSSLTVAYYGPCQRSCERIKCGGGRQCLVDQNMKPHCVRCAVRACPPLANSSTSDRRLCSADGVTYMSACYLREAACRKGRAIPIAYRGRCKDNATCDSIRCMDRQVCLSEPTTQFPRCVTCSYKCKSKNHRMHLNIRGSMDTVLCGTNNLTYYSWCHMLHDACSTGYIIDTRHAGACRTDRGSTTRKKIRLR